MLPSMGGLIVQGRTFVVCEVWDAIDAMRILRDQSTLLEYV